MLPQCYLFSLSSARKKNRKLGDERVSKLPSDLLLSVITTAPYHEPTPIKVSGSEKCHSETVATWIFWLLKGCVSRLLGIPWFIGPARIYNVVGLTASTS